MASVIQKFKIALPWIVNVLGGDWIRNRALHVPEANVLDACANATMIAGTPITPAMWRAVEATQAQILTDGIAVKAGSL